MKINVLTIMLDALSRSRFYPSMPRSVDLLTGLTGTKHHSVFFFFFDTFLKI
jgi:hypothetical protein